MFSWHSAHHHLLLRSFNKQASLAPYPCILCTSLILGMSNQGLTAADRSWHASSESRPAKALVNIFTCAKISRVFPKEKPPLQRGWWLQGSPLGCNAAKTCLHNFPCQATHHPPAQIAEGQVIWIPEIFEVWWRDGFSFLSWGQLKLSNTSTKWRYCQAGNFKNHSVW